MISVLVTSNKLAEARSDDKEVVLVQSGDDVKVASTFANPSDAVAFSKGIAWARDNAEFLVEQASD